MKRIKARSYFVEFKQKGFSKLEKLIENNDYSSVFILVDSNTLEYCVPLFKNKIIQSLKFQILSISPGEEFKTITSCQKIWQSLSDKGADKKSLIINLGGGVITDMGGFIASTYKRGIEFVNIPTTLLSMVDASIGGKTGIDFGDIKNQIGLISDPILVIIESDFLETLSHKEYRSGYSEMLKHGLISDKDYWNTLSDFLKKDNKDILPFIHKSIEIKNGIIFTKELYVFSEPNIRKEEIFILHEGTKVRLIDKLKGWQKIRLINGSEGWVVENQIKPL